MSQDIHRHRILILDFGSQYTQLIARRVREIGVYCEIYAWDVTEADIRAFDASGIILSGGPESVTEQNSPRAAESFLNSTFLSWVFATGCRPWPSKWVVRWRAQIHLNLAMPKFKA